MRFTATLAAAALLAAACGGTGNAAGTTVTLTQDDKTITLDRTTAPAGTVTFRAANNGTIVHALVLLKTDLPHDKIPADAKDGSKPQLTGLLRDWGQIPAGQTKEFSVKLESGNYVLVCTEPAHYIVGMHAGFDVK